MKLLKFNDIFKKTKPKKSKIEESVIEIIDFLIYKTQIPN